MLIYFQEIHDQNRYSGVFWNNKDIIIGNQSIFIKDWFQKGILYIKDLLDDNNTILGRQALQDKFNLNRIEPLFYNGIKIRLSKWLKKCASCVFEK